MKECKPAAGLTGPFRGRYQGLLALAPGPFGPVKGPLGPHTKGFALGAQALWACGLGP